MNYGENMPPIYTLVIYLDKSRMEVVPGSHRKTRMNSLQILTLKPVTNEMNAGDAILFHASLLHAGIFVHHTGERRVIGDFHCNTIGLGSST